VSAGLIGGAVYASAHRDTRTSAEKSAGCQKETIQRSPARGHVTTPVNYKNVPPSGGDHNPDPLPATPQFFARDQAPPPERAVHSQEHGWVIGWYDAKLGAADVAALRKTAISPTAQGRQFIAVPWQRSEFSGGRHFVLTAWGVTMRCKKVNEAAITDFLTKHEDKGPEKGKQAGSPIVPTATGSPTPTGKPTAKPTAKVSTKPSAKVTPKPSASATK
jgi:hypothetical protein